MQRELNAALDAVAAQATCEDGLEVDVVAMGDNTDAAFPAIYADLFSEKTFDPLAAVGATRCRPAMACRSSGADWLRESKRC